MWIFVVGQQVFGAPSWHLSSIICTTGLWRPLGMYVHGNASKCFEVYKHLLWRQVCRLQLHSSEVWKKPLASYVQAFPRIICMCRCEVPVEISKHTKLMRPSFWRFWRYQSVFVAPSWGLSRLLHAFESSWVCTPGRFKLSWGVQVPALATRVPPSASSSSQVPKDATFPQGFGLPVLAAHW